jgi:hypothetical protein
MNNHGNIQVTATANYHPALVAHFGSGALLDIDWEADLIDGTIEHECGGGAVEWSEDTEVIERMHIVELTIIGDGDDDDCSYNHDAISALPRAVRAELCAEAREVCEASR